MTTREELIGAVNQYLETLVEHDPSSLYLAEGARLTEDTHELRFDEGLWATATGVEPGGNYFIDATAGQAGYFGVVKMGATRAILGLRLKLEDGAISEVETTVVPQNDTMFGWEAVAAHRPAYDEVLMPNECRSREELVRVTNLYFDGIEQRNGAIIPVDSSVSRIENGIVTANRPKATSRPAPGSLDEMAEQGVREQISAGIHAYIARIRDRRVLVVDEERGLTFGVYVFDHDGGDEIVLPGGERRPMPAFARTPSSVLIWEAFKIRNGLITQIEAIGTMLPHGTKPGWVTA